MRRVSEVRFTLSSRGDLVRGRLFGADSRGKRPLVLFASEDGSTYSPSVVATARAWSAWCVLASIDLPLCGARRSEKLSQAVFDAASPLAARLRGDLESQLASDLEPRQTLDPEWQERTGAELRAMLSG